MTGYRSVGKAWRSAVGLDYSLLLKEPGPVSPQAWFNSNQSHLSVTAGFQSHRQANNEEEVMK